MMRKRERKKGGMRTDEIKGGGGVWRRERASD
jgi:hypothetical protein